MIFVNILPVIIFYICLVSQHSNAIQYEGDSNVESGKRTHIFLHIYRDCTVIEPMFNPKYIKGINRYCVTINLKKITYMI